MKPLCVCMMQLAAFTFSFTQSYLSIYLSASAKVKEANSNIRSHNGSIHSIIASPANPETFSSLWVNLRLSGHSSQPAQHTLRKTPTHDMSTYDPVPPQSYLYLSLSCQRQYLHDTITLCDSAREYAKSIGVG
jgi:hypothetical protein